MSMPDPQQPPEALVQPATDAGQPAPRMSEQQQWAADAIARGEIPLRRTGQPLLPTPRAQHDEGSLAGHLALMTDVAGRNRDSAARGTMTRARYEGWADALSEIRAWLRENPEPPGQLPASLVIRPGDKLVLGFTDKLSPAMVGRLKEASACRLPGVEVVVYDGVSGMAVCRAGES